MRLKLDIAFTKPYLMPVYGVTC